MLLVFDNETSTRLDVWLSEQTGRSRSFIKTCHQNEQLTVNNKKTKLSLALKQGDKIEIFLDEKPLEYKPVDIALDIVFEDEHIIVINKPSGLTVHPGAGNKDNTLVNALLHYGKELSNIGGLERPGIVHRLDKDTSGLMVVAKNNEAHERMAKLFETRNIIKKYLALVHGYLPHDQGSIDAPIGRMPNNYKKMQVDYAKGKQSLTDYSVIKESNEKTLVELTLHTGRTHQIRVHLAHLGHPVVGDSVYGKAGKGKTQLLHSYSLQFNHPITGENLLFKTDLPSWGKF
jgi:23S rRNA pseudouridine1911/1915/1917 synthase